MNSSISVDKKYLKTKTESSFDQIFSPNIFLDDGENLEIQPEISQPNKELFTGLELSLNAFKQFHHLKRSHPLSALSSLCPTKMLPRPKQ